MRQLKTDFIGKGEVKGFEFTQLKKTDYGYIYAVNNGENVYFEVFKYKENDKYDCVLYPKTKDFAFGAWAFATSTFEHACEILEDLKPV